MVGIPVRRDTAKPTAVVLPIEANTVEDKFGLCRLVLQRQVRVGIEGYSRQICRHKLAKVVGPSIVVVFEESNGKVRLQQ